jgi:hypothetical protein
LQSLPRRRQRVNVARRGVAAALFAATIFSRRRTMRMLRAVAALVLLLGAPAAAQEGDIAAAKELMAVMHDELVGEMVDALSPSTWASIEGALKGKATMDAPTTRDLHAAIDPLVKEYIVRSLAEAPAIYAKRFTTDELRALTAFYKSPLGKKALWQMPKALGDLVQLAFGPKLAELQPKIEDAVKNVLRQRRSIR